MRAAGAAGGTHAARPERPKGPDLPRRSRGQPPTLPPPASRGGEAAPVPPLGDLHRRRHTPTAPSPLQGHPVAAWWCPQRRPRQLPRPASPAQPHQDRPLPGRSRRRFHRLPAPGSAPACSGAMRRWPTSTTSSTAWSGLPTARRPSSGSSEPPDTPNIYIHPHTYIYFDKCSVHREVTSGRRHGREAPMKKRGRLSMNLPHPSGFVLNVKNWEQF